MNYYGFEIQSNNRREKAVIQATKLGKQFCKMNVQTYFKLKMLIYFKLVK